MVPPGGDAQRLVREVTPALMDARRTRAASLEHSPAGAPELRQRSRMVAPLIAQRELLGYLYADIDGAFGRFREADRELLAMLASQAAVALANAQWSQGLEEKVEQRTEELQASNAQLEQRASELAVINSIQQGMAASLDFQGIIDLVGDKLREVFHTGDLTIRWWEEETGLTHWLYCHEHGKRLQLEPTKLATRGLTFTALTTRQAQVVNTRDLPARNVVPGTDTARCIAAIPIVGSDRVLGTIQLENYERENAFGDAELRLLTTVAASMGVALESARNFGETQRLLKETAQRAAELAVINSIQQGVSENLDFQKIIDLVGDKLREVFSTGEVSIKWWDEKTGLLHTPYGYEHGVRYHLESRPVQPGGLPERVLRGREIGLVNTVAEAKALGIQVVAGTDTPLSSVRVPIVAGDHALGYIMLENYEREYA